MKKETCSRDKMSSLPRIFCGIAFIRRFLNLDKLLSFFERANPIILSLATIVLALITYLHMDEAKNMRLELRQQFKITSYPALEIKLNPPTIARKPIRQEIVVTNTGKVVALKVDFFICYVYGQEGEGRDFHIPRNSYVDEKSTYEFNVNITPGETLSYISDIEEGKIDYLRNIICILRFRVPFDPLDSYQMKTYKFDHTIPGWIPMPITSEKELYRRLLNVINQNNFLKDLNGTQREFVLSFMTNQI